MEEGAGEAGQLGGSLVVECGGVAAAEESWLKLILPFITLVIGFLLGLVGRIWDERRAVSRAREAVKSEAVDLMAESKSSVLDYCSVLDDLREHLNAVKKGLPYVRVDYCYVPPMMLLAIENNRDMFRDPGDQGFRRAIRNCLSKYEACWEVFKDFQQSTAKSLSGLTQREVEYRIEDLEELIRNYTVLWYSAKELSEGNAAPCASGRGVKGISDEVNRIIGIAQEAFERELPKM